MNRIFKRHRSADWKTSTFNCTLVFFSNFRELFLNLLRSHWVLKRLYQKWFQWNIVSQNFPFFFKIFGKFVFLISKVLRHLSVITVHNSLCNIKCNKKARNNQTHRNLKKNENEIVLIFFYYNHCYNCCSCNFVIFLSNLFNRL